MGTKNTNGQGQGRRSELFDKLAEQSGVVDQQSEQIRTQGSTINKQARVIVAQGQVLGEQNRKIETLARGLYAMASAFGPEAVQHITAAMSRVADVQNPAQPIPEPPAQPADFSTQDAKTPEAMESPQNPGLVPGSTNDVAADATTTVYQPGQDLPGSGLNHLTDVTTPVDGTQGPQPLNTVRTETDIRVGDPNNQSQAFPLRGPFQQQQNLGRGANRQDQGERRTYASLRLVEARAATGDDEAVSGNRYALAQAISKDASRSTEMIEEEAATLEKVSSRIGRTAATQAPRGLVPRQASAAPRSAPSMSSEASYGSGNVSVDLEGEASDIFWD